MKYTNPIITGFYPDPSIVRVGKNYYLVTSTFEYFPGVPIFHSTDLVNWTQIGHCLNRESQLSLNNIENPPGIFAPTIRYNNGKFYMITTNVANGGNFYVYTENPEKDWSEPIWVEQGGIDPSLFFDEDGKVYFSSTTEDGAKVKGIAQCEIDINTGKRLSETKFIWEGSGGRYPEGPHLYKRNNMYYLMIAEGGTEYGHMVTIARSHAPYGPFESYEKNPILTHRNVEFPQIAGTGHGDLVEDDKGNWWMVFLGFRPAGGDFHHLGRETFLSPVEWNEEGWPVVNKKGTVSREMESDKITSVQKINNSISEEFNEEKLNFQWNFIKNPEEGMYSLKERKGYLRLYGLENNLNSKKGPVAFVGMRQKEFEVTIEAAIDFYPKQSNEEAGITVLMDIKHHYEISITNCNGKRKIIVRRTIGTLSAITAEREVQEGNIILYIKAEELQYKFAYSINGQEEIELDAGETRYLASEVAGGFKGVYFGLYATGNGTKCSIPADFHWVKSR